MGRVDVNTVHVDLLDALVKDVMVPRRTTILAAQDQNKGRIQQSQGLRPLRRLLGIVLLGHLQHLPVPPHLVA